MSPDTQSESSTEGEARSACVCTRALDGDRGAETSLAQPDSRTRINAKGKTIFLMACSSAGKRGPARARGFHFRVGSGLLVHERVGSRGHEHRPTIGAKKARSAGQDSEARVAHALPERPAPGNLAPNRRLEPAWGCSSAGRALDWQSRGRRFDPVQLHHFTSVRSARVAGSRMLSAFASPMATPESTPCSIS